MSENSLQNNYQTESNGGVEDRTELPSCPYCGNQLVKWAVPPGTSWGEGFHFVCFNDECPYLVRGWQWMWNRYQVQASYRHRYDPSTGETGPLPVWSMNALKNNIINE